MSKPSRPPLAVAASAVAVAASVIVFPPVAHAAPCTQWAFPDNPFTMRQADGWFVKVPTAGSNLGPGPSTYTKPDKDDPSNGTATGGINGDRIEIVIPWSNGSTGTFTGNIGPDGRVTSGIASSSANFRTSWTSSVPMKCAVFAEEPKPEEPKPEEQQGLGKLEVVQSTDVFDAPDGEGNEVGVLLPPGTQVQIVGEGCRNDWCNVAVAGAPGGVGWVFQPHFKNA